MVFGEVRDIQEAFEGNANMALFFSKNCPLPKKGLYFFLTLNR